MWTHLSPRWIAVYPNYNGSIESIDIAVIIFDSFNPVWAYRPAESLSERSRIMLEFGFAGRTGNDFSNYQTEVHISEYSRGDSGHLR